MAEIWNPFTARVCRRAWRSVNRMARSLEHYLPLYSERSTWTDRGVDLERPLFTGYIFVRFAREARISVVSAPGVLRPIASCCSRRPSPSTTTYAVLYATSVSRSEWSER